MQLSLTFAAETPVITVLESRIDASNAEAFRSGVMESAPQGCHRIIIDLSKVSFIDSRALGTMISILKTLGPKGVLNLCGLNSNVESVFKLTRLNRVFGIFPDLAAAAREFEKNPVKACEKGPDFT